MSGICDWEGGGFRAEGWGGGGWEGRGWGGRGWGVRDLSDFFGIFNGRCVYYLGGFKGFITEKQQYHFIIEPALLGIESNMIYEATEFTRSLQTSRRFRRYFKIIFVDLSKSNTGFNRNISIGFEPKLA